MWCGKWCQILIGLSLVLVFTQVSSFTQHMQRLFAKEMLCRQVKMDILLYVRQVVLADGLLIYVCEEVIGLGLYQRSVLSSWLSSA